MVPVGEIMRVLVVAHEEMADRRFVAEDSPAVLT
jgi:hypothetical protein